MILVKTDAGQQVLKDRSVRLTPRQRAAFILCDGKRSITDVLAAGMGVGADDIAQMIELGLLASADGVEAVAAAPVPLSAASAAPPAPPTTVSSAVAAAARLAEPGGPEVSAQQRYQDAYPIATRLTGGLGLRGFRLNLAVEGTSSYEQLLALAPKIRSAVGLDKSVELDRALGI